MYPNCLNNGENITNAVFNSIIISKEMQIKLIPDNDLTFRYLVT